MALASAAARARALAAEEHRKMMRQTAELVQAQLKSVELKMTHFEQLQAFAVSEKAAAV